MSYPRIVVVLDERVPTGVGANTTALLGLSLGAMFPDVVGPEVRDGSGVVHPGISALPVPVLRASADRLTGIAGRARDSQGITVVDITDTARRARTYDQYREQLSILVTDRQEVLGIAIHGPGREVTALTGDLPLYR